MMISTVRRRTGTPGICSSFGPLGICKHELGLLLVLHHDYDIARNQKVYYLNYSESSSTIGQAFPPLSTASLVSQPTSTCTIFVVYPSFWPDEEHRFAFQQLEVGVPGQQVRVFEGND